MTGESKGRMVASREEEVKWCFLLKMDSKNKNKKSQGCGTG